jgi:hypothetical protein
MNRRRTDPAGKPVVAVRLDGRDKLPSQNPLAVKLGAISRAAESRPAREPSRDVIDRANRSQAMEAREMRMAPNRAAAKKATATAAEAAAIDRANRAQARAAREMESFRDTTRMRYMQGGDEYAKGGSVKGAAKVAKVMGEFKRGELHSGSKKGPKVTNPKQATAIAMSEARAAGAKMPAPKKRGVPVASREPMIKR